MSKREKISEKELSELQSVLSKKQFFSSRVVSTSLMHMESTVALSNAKKEEDALRKRISKRYGQDAIIDPSTGAITYKPSEQAESKDN